MVILWESIQATFGEHNKIEWEIEHTDQLTGWEHEELSHAAGQIEGIYQERWRS